MNPKRLFGPKITLTTTMIVTIDPFGNTVITYSIDATPSVEQLIEDVKNNPNPKNLAIILVGVDRQTADKYNLQVPPNEQMLYQTISDGLTRHVIFNQSSCPKLHDVDGTGIGKLYSSQVLVRVNFNNQDYFLVVKDRTKPVAMLPGGTADYDEVKLNQVDYVGIAIRELFEETQGKINDSVEMGMEMEIEVDGIRTDRNQYGNPIAKVKYLSRLLGLSNIDDTSSIFMIDVGIKDNMLEYLFRPQNKQEDGSYQLSFVNHAEIAYVAAYPLWLQINLPDPIDPLEKMKMIIATKPKTVSGMAWYLALATHFNLLSANTFDNSEELKKIGFPPTIQSITF